MAQCPLCGQQTDDPAPLDGCQKLCDELCAYSLGRARPPFVHQHVVDAYAAQHQTPDSKPIQAVFALMGLYLMAEKDFDGVEVQNAHVELTRDKPTEGWPRIGDPPKSFALTVGDVLTAPEGETRDEKIREWAASAWSAWATQQHQIREIASLRLGVD